MIARHGKVVRPNARTGISRYHNLPVFLNGDGTFQAEKRFGSGGNFTSAVVAGDVNEDGRLDLVTANPGGLAVVLGRGNGTFLVPHVLPQPSRGVIAGVAIGELNGDGHLDLVTNFSDSGGQGFVMLYLGQGNGTFRAPQSFFVGRLFSESIVLRDLNGDGHLDVVRENRLADTVSVVLGRGDGTFRAALHFGVGDFPWAMAVADVNEASRLDLITANSDSSVSVLLQ